jgi:hypothetical protein
MRDEKMVMTGMQGRRKDQKFDDKGSARDQTNLLLSPRVPLKFLIVPTKPATNW